MITQTKDASLAMDHTAPRNQKPEVKQIDSLIEM
jgi:hypothetical protein